MHDGLVADDVPFWELADDTRDVFFFHSARLKLCAEFLGGFRVLADEHNAAGQSVKSITGQRVPLVAAFRAHNLNDGVVVVAAGGMDGNAGGLGDDYYVVVFVDDANSLGGHGGFMSVEGVGDDVAVLDNGLERWDWLAV